MTIQLRFFASLREQLGEAECWFDISTQGNETLSVADLRQQLQQRGPEWSVLMDADIHAAVNQQLVEESHVIVAGDEVAFFPPVTGG